LELIRGMQVPYSGINTLHAAIFFPELSPMCDTPMCNSMYAGHGGIHTPPRTTFAVRPLYSQLQRTSASRNSSTLTHLRFSLGRESGSRALPGHGKTPNKRNLR